MLQGDKKAGAEQYMRIRSTEAVPSRRKCAEERRETCHICTEALHRKRRRALCGCACADGGIAHVRLAEQAKILVAEAVENT